MIAKYSTPRYFGKRAASRIKKKIRSRFPTLTALAREIDEKPQYVFNIVNGITRSRRVAQKIEQAVGEKLFPYTEDNNA